jgi:DNA-binding NarL/FixJ family response regulator
VGFRVLIADDHPLFRRGMAALISQERWCSGYTETGSIEETRAACEASLPDLLLMDLSFGTVNALTFIKELHTRWDKLLILVISMHEEEMYAQRVLKAGARGYVMKQEPPETILEAARIVLSNRVYLSPALRERLVDQWMGPSGASSGVEGLSDRELEVLRLIGQGFGTQAIAEALHLSVKTVETHREHVKQKLKLENAQALRRFAVGLSDHPV